MGSPVSPVMAAVRYDKGYPVDDLLGAVCRRLASDGARLGGLIQLSSVSRPDACRSFVHVRDLLSGRTFDIWDGRAVGDTVCRLDEGKLDGVARALDDAIAQRVDLLVINRFGRAESKGRGLRPYFERAVARGIPVLTAVRGSYAEAWDTFADAWGERLPCTVADATEWAHQHIAGPATAFDASAPRPLEHATNVCGAADRAAR